MSKLSKGIQDSNGELYQFIPPIASTSVAGGVTAKEKTNENKEIAIDSTTGRLYVEDHTESLKNDLSNLTGNQLYAYVRDKSISRTTPTEQNTEVGWESILIPCVPGDTFYVKGRGGSSTRLWMFIDSNGTVVLESTSGTIAEEFIKIIVPNNAVYLAVNSKYTEIEGKLIKNELVRDSIVSINDSFYGKTLKASSIPQVSENRNYDFTFDKPLELLGESIDIKIDATGSIKYNVYVMYDKNASDRRMIVREAKSSVFNSYAIDRPIYGIRIWVSSANNASLNVTCESKGVSGTLGKFEKLGFIEDSILLNDFFEITEAGVNHNFMFAVPETYSDNKLDITVDSSSNGLMYSLFAILSPDSTSLREIVKVGREISEYKCSVAAENGETIYGVRLEVPQQSISDGKKAISLKCERHSISKRISDIETSYVKSDDLHGYNVITLNNVYISGKVNRDIIFENPISLKGLKFNVDIKTESTGKYSIYQLYDLHGTRENIKNNLSGDTITESVVGDKPVIGIRIYPQDTAVVISEINLELKGLASRVSGIEEYVTSDLIMSVNDKSINSDVNYDFRFDNPLTKTGEKYKISLKNTIPTHYKLYVLYDENGSRDTICEHKFESETIFEIKDKPVVGIRIYVVNDVSTQISFTIKHLGISDRFLENEKVDSDDILSLHPRKVMASRLASLKWRQGNNNDVFPNAMLSLIYFSDLHGDRNKLARIMKFRKEYWQYIDDCIHPGDAVLNCYESGYDFWDEVGAQSVLTCNGNHDCWTGRPNESGCAAWTTGYSAKQGYERYIKPYVDIQGITDVPNKMYWYKDYSSSKIRIIALDQYHWRETVTLSNNTTSTEYPDGTSVDTGQQYSWFVETLAEAKSKGYHVMVMVHLASSNITGFDCSFNSLEFYPNGKIADEAIVAVQNFIDDGGQFISWVCGHCHNDWFATLTDYPNQTIMTIDTARGKRDDGTTWSRNTKVDGTVSQDCFNILSIDTNFKYIRMFRVGLEYDRHGRHVGEILYNYETHKVVWNS